MEENKYTNEIGILFIERMVDYMEMWKMLREVQDVIDLEDFWNMGDDANIGYDLPDGKHHLYIYVDDSIEGKVIVVEPNLIVDGAHEPCGECGFSPIDYPEELLITIAWVIETQCV